MKIRQRLMLRQYLICQDQYIRNQYRVPHLKVFLKKKYRASTIRKQIDADSLCKILDHDIQNKNFTSTKRMIKLINYSLFRDSSLLPIYIKCLSESANNNHDRIHRLLLAEDTRLNIWLLIKLSTEALHDKVSPEFLHEFCDRIKNSQLRLIFEPRIYQHLFCMIHNHKNSRHILKIINQYLVFHHKSIMNRILYKSWDSTKIIKRLKPISNTIVEDVKQNRFVALCIDLKILKGTMLKLAKKSRYCLTNRFYVLVHDMVSDRASQFFNKKTSKSIIQQIEQYNIFLLCLQPSLLLKYGTLTQMQKFLADLPRKNKYFSNIGVKFSLDAPANTLSYSRVVASLYSFIKYVKDKQCDILSNMISNRVV